MPGIVVFLGPSLDRPGAARILAAEYRPPAARGDLTRAADEGARIIGLIDGVFFQESAVGHREILYALHKGARVVGASSMGALRAAELHTLGMEGVGRIFRCYRDGIITSDDEVALLFDPEYHTPLSEPLVNIRWAAARAAKEGIITEGEGFEIVDAAEALYFTERTYPLIARMAGLEGNRARAFLQFAAEPDQDLKRLDAVEALLRMKEIAAEIGI
ncbi:MAG: TfuA-related McrA-glycine thioamidation protein [Methanomicrobiales archaeon]|nr:TfuA-related McrA-glycine thioamidation protein [Methanomicrobiales archaeon]MDD1657947.1 TfuA-related McrA-glycine thioamidation protein [Methanomicrobiales archaeon]